MVHRLGVVVLLAGSFPRSLAYALSSDTGACLLGDKTRDGVGGAMVLLFLPCKPVFFRVGMLAYRTYRSEWYAGVATPHLVRGVFISQSQRCGNIFLFTEITTEKYICYSVPPFHDVPCIEELEF
jgi:hypothetical protein